jgi:GT2 family glycosyltransferase
MGADASVEVLPHGHYRIRWRLPDPPPLVSLIIPTRDKLDLLKTCVESILALTSYPNYEILVVDNQSSERETLDYMRSLQTRERVSVLHHDQPFNYSAINNWAARRASGEIIGLVNNDIEVISPDWLDEMASQAWRPEVGAVGAMLYYPDDRIQHAGVILGLGGIANHAYAGLPKGYAGHGGRARVCQYLSAVTAACLLVRRDVFDQVGGLDEKLQVAFNDVDFCLRLREAGYWNIWTPFAELYHHESASRGTEDSPEKIERFLGEVALMEQRWRHLLRVDPAYNRNLTLMDQDFSLAFPPRA